MKISVVLCSIWKMFLNVNWCLVWPSSIHSIQLILSWLKKACKALAETLLTPGYFVKTFIDWTVLNSPRVGRFDILKLRKETVLLRSHLRWGALLDELGWICRRWVIVFWKETRGKTNISPTKEMIQRIGHCKKYPHWYGFGSKALQQSLFSHLITTFNFTGYNLLTTWKTELWNTNLQPN